jgi:glutamate racemase
MGEGVRLIDSARQVAMEVHKILQTEGLLSKNGKGKQKFYVSDNPEWFSALAKEFLGQPVKNAKKVASV